MGTGAGASSPKKHGRRMKLTSHPPHLMSRLKMSNSYTPLHIRLHRAHRDIFTCTIILGRVFAYVGSPDTMLLLLRANEQDINFDC